MKILQAVGWYFPHSLGGTEIYVDALCQGLVRAGHQPVVAVPSPGATQTERGEHRGITVIRYPTPAQPTRDEAQGRSRVRGFEHFAGILAAEQPDLVHVHTFVTGLGIHEVEAAQRAGARVIVTTHSSSLGFVCQRGTLMRWGARACDGVRRPVLCAACELQHRGLPKPLAGALAALPASLSRRAGAWPGRLGTALGMRDLIDHNGALQRRVLAAVDRFVVLTESARSILLANGAPPDKIVVNRLGLSQREVTPKPSPDQAPTRSPVAFGYLGRYDPIKGVRDLVRAAASLPPELEFSLTFRGPLANEGDRSLRDELARLAGGDPRITFGGPLEPAAVAEFLAGLDLLCCPSRCAEGGPTVAIEAIAVGTPVLGTRIGGLAELVNDERDGLLVPPADPGRLASALRRVAAEPAVLDALRRRLPTARTMEQVAGDYLEIYRR